MWVRPLHMRVCVCKCEVRGECSHLVCFHIVNHTHTHTHNDNTAPFTPGVAVDLSHIPTAVDVKGYAGPENLAAALDGSKVGTAARVCE
jgi:hypothetical protein